MANGDALLTRVKAVELVSTLPISVLLFRVTIAFAAALAVAMLASRYQLPPGNLFGSQAK
jgi:hypothetical protein